MSSFEIISDYSKASLKDIPENILEMTNLKMLFLESNFLVKLPENFFYRLPYLMWLDLRNNQLDEIPKSIAYHAHLEHLLLTNNNIRRLPNELGLSPNLKALQVADNPLLYPPKKIVQEGTKAIKKYLKEQYEIERENNAGNRNELINAEKEIKRLLTEKQRMLEMQEEQLLKVHEKGSDIGPLEQGNNQSRDTFYSAPKINANRSRESTTANRPSNMKIEQLQQLSDPNGLGPTLRVKKIEHPTKKPEEPLKIIHSVSKSDEKITLKSYYNKSGVNGKNLDRIPENVLKEGWLNKLRILLNDQERILQQERNLQALTSWRQKRPNATPKTFCESSTRRSETPYATDPEYSRIPSRADLANQLQSFLREGEVVNKSRPVQASKFNLDKVINDLVQQLKEMENYTNEVVSPRSEMEHAGIQIQTIIDIHKKLLQLKSANDSL